MLVIGRITKDATVNVLQDERQVVNFSIAVNDFYKPKSASEPVKFTTYINCSYWKSARVAERLKKGALVELTGRIFVNAYTDLNGNAKASLNCHVNSIRVHSYGKEVEVAGRPSVAVASREENQDDTPF